MCVCVCVCVCVCAHTFIHMYIRTDMNRVLYPHVYCLHS